MQVKATIGLLSLVVVIGLLLGGNVLADGVSLPTTDTQDISAQIEQIRQKIADLTAQAQQQTTGQPAATITKKPLTQQELVTIESEVNRITKEVARLKIEVQIFVTLREIQHKTELLKSQIAAAPTLGGAVTTAPKPPVQTASILTEQQRQEIETQIAKIKQQIAETTQELEVIKMAQTKSTATVEQETSEAVPAAVESQEISQIPVTISEKPAPEPEKKSFWQTIGDFLKKIFTF